MQIRLLQDDACAGVQPVAPACHLPDGFHTLPWTAVNLAQLAPAWDHLARDAASPNSFFESWYLTPSLEAFDPRGDVSLAMLVEGGELRGLMPSWLDPSYQGRPLVHIAPWLHANMFCGTPLVSKGWERAFWQSYLERTDATSGRAWFLHLPLLPLDCAVTRSLVSLCAEQGRQVAEVLHRSRAVLNHGFTPGEHLQSAMSAKKRKELRRQRARLEKEGPVSIRRTRGTELLDKWIGEFLALELRGWKGERGSALASDPRNEQLFRQSLAGASALGRLERIAMYCGDRPIAMLATFLAEPGAYSFKTSFDEDFARFSPGLLLQVENLALLEDPDLEWCDSCAAVDHPMIERIWRDRREMVWLSVGVGRGLRRKMGELWARIEAWREERRA